MSLLPLSQSVVDPKVHWITPEEQLTRLARPIAEEGQLTKRIITYAKTLLPSEAA
jgi:hypothetical protein